jgi:hypothetical protein
MEVWSVNYNFGPEQVTDSKTQDHFDCSGTQGPSKSEIQNTHSFHTFLQAKTAVEKLKSSL